jgi:hypothetical protein
MNKNLFRVGVVITLVAVFSLFAVSLAVQPAIAGTERIPFKNYNIACSYQEGKVWVSDDGIVHLRGRVLQSVIISDVPEYFAGTGQIVGNANIFDPAFGLGTYFGSLEIYPTAMDGYWAGKWTVQITEDGPKGIAQLKGYGPDLKGMLSKGTLGYLAPTELANFAYLCGGNQPVAGTLAEGVLLIQGGD